MIITLIPTEEIGNVWHDASILIDKAWDQSPGYYRSIDILDLIFNGVECLWCVYDDDLKMVGCFTTVINQYPLSRVMLISCLAGERIEEWYGEALEIVKRFSKDQGCTKLEAKGRRGWNLYAKKTGWREIASIYQLSLEED